MERFEAGRRVKSLLALYKAAESIPYGSEQFSHTYHALSSAFNAKLAHADDELVIATLLHDVGHLLTWDNLRRHADIGVIDHDRAGGDYLEQLGFSHRVCELVRGHVEARRYLVTTSDPYAARLTPSAIMALELNGGPMTGEQVDAFRANPHSHDCLQLLSFEELVHDHRFKPHSILTYEDMLIEHLMEA